MRLTSSDNLLSNFKKYFNRLYGLKQSPRACLANLAVLLNNLTKDLGKLQYFLGIKVTQSKDGVVISQRKYALDILEETALLNSKFDPSVNLLPNQGEPFKDPERYRRLVGKLNYLTVTRPDISLAVSMIKTSPGKSLEYEDKGQIKVVGYSDVDWVGCPTDRRSTSGYCVFVRGSLIF
ncbi:uncharacterized mitochondrial protein AtMg00810-like [Gastrolobium bilobum]|uniref:uncharacterized mitochondrial protein AtMg00810-like n=1 Tax=Gastrolobium bilobum TaxID=150636 RepID=UPI002AAFBC35|nr:uncharacterized mitochondrial protein AtMg00810-like [Gastrolobium bilobum]